MRGIRSKWPRGTKLEGADELVFLDITASHEQRDIMIDVVRRTAEQVMMPLTVGGGIRTMEDIRALLNAGSDKVSINSAACQHPEFVRAAARRFGSQCIVVNIDPKRVQRDGREVWEVHINGGRTADGAGGGELGTAGRGAGRGRDRLDEHGLRRHQGRIRPGNHGGGERGGVDSGGRQWRGGVSGALGGCDPDRQGRCGVGRQHFSFRGIHDSGDQTGHAGTGNRGSAVRGATYVTR